MVAQRLQCVSECLQVIGGCAFAGKSGRVRWVCESCDSAHGLRRVCLLLSFCEHEAIGP